MKIAPLALVAGLLAAGCGAGGPAGSTPTPAAASPTRSPATQAPPSLAPSATVTHLPASIDAAPVVVFTIRNEGVNPGVVGAPQPARMAWGAQGFTVAPDGTFWIADSAAQPARLLHFDRSGNLLDSVPGGQFVSGLVDVVASDDRVWSFWISSGIVLEMSTEGEVLREVFLPPGVEGSLIGISLGQGGELIAEFPEWGKRVVILDALGNPASKPIGDYPCGGRVFHLDFGGAQDVIHVPEGYPVVMVDGLRIPIEDADPLAGFDFLGCDAEGNFFMSVDRFRPGAAIGVEEQVRRYAADGVLTGLAHLPVGVIYAPNDLAVGPDGQLYAMVSREDYSVDILRMSLEAGLPPGPTATATATVPVIAALRPTWTVVPTGADGLAIAREALLQFFTFLHDGRYAQAAPLYGGSYAPFLDLDPNLDTQDGAKVWEYGCQMLYGCQLLVGNIVEARRVSSAEYEFLIEFVTDGGELFKLGPCCGATEAEMPPVWRFPYTVRVIDGTYRVMEMPVYVP